MTEEETIAAVHAVWDEEGMAAPTDAADGANASPRYVRNAGPWWIFGLGPRAGLRCVACTTGMDGVPNDPVEAARQLARDLKRHVAREEAAALTTDATLEPPAADVSHGNVEGTTSYDVVNVTEEPAPEAIDEPTSETAEFDAPEPEILEETTDDGDVAAIDEPLTIEGEFADFGEPEDLGSELLDSETYALDPLLLESTQESLPPYEYQRPDNSGGVAYFGDDIHVARLAKMGRLSQIARDLKATLQDGWSLGEFASLQNLIVRMDRGEAPDDAGARERFLWITERSRAMSRVDAFKDVREGELEGYANPLDREAILAFNPEAGWPE